MNMAEFKLLNDRRYQYKRRREWLIGAQFWSGLTVAIPSGVSGVVGLLGGRGMPIWATLLLIASPLLAMLLFHINQRQLDRVDAQMDEVLKGVLVAPDEVTPG